MSERGPDETEPRAERTDRTEPIADEEHEHKGSFAEGQEVREHHPEVEREGDFAEGQEEVDHPAGGAEHTGTFAEGEADEGHHEAPAGDFAEGVEQEHHEH